MVPFLPERLLGECQTFIHATTNPSPRAADGANDDAVMAAAITMEMYRLRGSHPRMTARRERNRRPKQSYDTLYPWIREDGKKQQRKMDERYPPERSDEAA